MRPDVDLIHTPAFGKVVDPDLSQHLPCPSCYRGAMSCRGLLHLLKEFRFEPVNGTINDRIDDAYRAKYRDSPFLSPMIAARARSATVKVMPREGGA